MKNVCGGWEPLSFPAVRSNDRRGVATRRRRSHVLFVPTKTSRRLVAFTPQPSGVSRLGCSSGSTAGRRRTSWYPPSTRTASTGRGCPQHKNVLQIVKGDASMAGDVDSMKIDLLPEITALFHALSRYPMSPSRNRGGAVWWGRQTTGYRVTTPAQPPGEAETSHGANRGSRRAGGARGGRVRLGGGSIGSISACRSRILNCELPESIGRLQTKFIPFLRVSIRHRTNTAQ